MKTLIKNISNVNSEGFSFRLTEKAKLIHGGISTKEWWVSWDAVGEALFKEQYSDATSVKELTLERGNE